MCGIIELIKPTEMTELIMFTVLIVNSYIDVNGNLKFRVKNTGNGKTTRVSLVDVSRMAHYRKACEMHLEKLDIPYKTITNAGSNGKPGKSTFYYVVEH